MCGHLSAAGGHRTRTRAITGFCRGVALDDLAVLVVLRGCGQREHKRGSRKERERNQTDGVHGSTPWDEVRAATRGRRLADESEADAGLARGPRQLLLVL